MSKNRTKFKLYGSMDVFPKTTRLEYRDQRPLSVDPLGMMAQIIEILSPLKRTLIWSTN